MGDYYGIEVELNDYVRKKVKPEFFLHYFDEVAHQWKYQPYIFFQDNTKYKLQIRARMTGKGCSVQDVQIRVKNINPNIEYYSDDSFTTEISKCESITFPDTLGQDDITPYHNVFFLVKNVPSGNDVFARVGIYAKIIPWGHYWESLTGYFD